MSTLKVRLMRRVMLLLGRTPRKETPIHTIAECVERCSDVEEKVYQIEQATLSWTTADLTEDQLRSSGLIE